ncbi:MAG: sulfotransferase [Gammaproteobacteria bacterium]
MPETSNAATNGITGPLSARLLGNAVRTINALGAALARLGVSPASLDEADLLRAARRRTGLHDFGPAPLQAPLRMLLRGCNTEAGLNLLGRISTRWDILRLLSNRLLLQRDWQQAPDIFSQPVERPVFIMGLPRSGTTLLHSLMAQDPALRYPSHWETMYPSPPPERDSYDRDPRIAAVERQLQWFHRLAPEFRAIHLMNARYPQECTEITNHVFMSLRYDTVYDVPSYRAWLDSTGHGEAYRFHRQMLQHLQWRCPPRRWVLKAPDHVFALTDLLETYPDACILMAHRDPLKVVPSVASMTTVLQRVFSDRVDPAQVARTVGERWAEGARRMVHSRRQDDTPRRYLDVHYLDLVRDPMAMIHRIYDHFGMSLSSQARQSMEAFLARNPKGRHGNHRYSLHQFGLDPDEQRRQYREYLDYFGVESEDIPA